MKVILTLQVNPVKHERQGQDSNLCSQRESVFKTDALDHSATLAYGTKLIMTYKALEFAILLTVCSINKITKVFRD